MRVHANILYYLMVHFLLLQVIYLFFQMYIIKNMSTMVILIMRKIYGTEICFLYTSGLNVQRYSPCAANQTG